MEMENRGIPAKGHAKLPYRETEGDEPFGVVLVITPHGAAIEIGPVEEFILFQQIDRSARFSATFPEMNVVVVYPD